MLRDVVRIMCIRERRVLGVDRDAKALMPLAEAKKNGKYGIQ
jgi:hypothetical protein